MLGGAGHWSIFRLLKYPIEGYLGYLLGPVGAHITQFITHIICVLLFYLLLKRIEWSTAASLTSALLFCVLPWISQAIYWWAAATTIWATILILGSAHCLISWHASSSRRWIYCYILLVFLSLALYEMWLGGLIFFIALAWYLDDSEKDSSGTRNNPISGAFGLNFLHYAWLVVPFLLYAAIYRIAPSSEVADRLILKLSSLPVLLAFIHLRVLQWPIDTQWHWTIANAGRAYLSTTGLICVGLEVVILASLSYIWMRRVGTFQSSSSKIQFWRAFILGWSIFLGSRIALVAQGFISRFESRQNYAASMGIIVVLVALVSRILQRHLSGTFVRRLIGPALCSLVFLLGWTSSGIGVHYEIVSESESHTIRQLSDWISASHNKSRLSIIVVEAPAETISHGTLELLYFSEHDGSLLRSEMKPFCHNCTIFVTDKVSCINGNTAIYLHDSNELVGIPNKGPLLLGDDTEFFRWTGKELVQEHLSCR